MRPIVTAVHAAAGRDEICAASRAKRRVQTLRRWRGLFCAALVFATALPAYSQPPAADSAAVSQPPATAETVALADVEAGLKQVEVAADLDDAAKGKLREYYQQARQHLTDAAAATEKAQVFQQQARTAKDDIAKAKQALAAPLQPFDFEAAAFTDLGDLETQLSELEKLHQEAKTELAAQEARPQQRAARRTEIPKLIAAAKERLEDAQRQLQATDPQQDSPLVVQARKTVLQARRQWAQAEIAMLESELAAYDATTDLLPLQRDRAARRLAQLDEDVKTLRARVNDRRRRDAQTQAASAQAAVKAVPAGLEELASDILQRTEKRLELAKELDAASTRLAESDEHLQELREERRLIESRVAKRTTKTLGTLLQQKHAELLDRPNYRRDVEERQRTIQELQTDLLDLEVRRSDLADIKVAAEKKLQELRSKTPTPPLGPDPQQQIVELLTTEREILDQLLADTNRYFERLIELNTVEQDLADEIEGYSAFIEQRIFWIRSTEPLDPRKFDHYARAAFWLIDLRSWRAVGQTLLADVIEYPAIAALAAAVLLLLLFYQRRFRKKIIELGDAAARGSCREFAPTAKALGLTLLVASPWAYLMWHLGWRLGASYHSDEFAKALSAGLSTLAICFFPLELFRQTCRRSGLAEAHFGWSPRVLRLLRPNLRHLILAAIPLLLVAATLRAQKTEFYNDSLGRVCFIVLLLLTSWFLWRVFRPEGGVFHERLALHPGGWLDRLRYVWYGALVGTPLAFAVLAGIGYYYTSWQLMWRLDATLLLLLAVLALGALLFRWVLMARRRLAIQQARERLAQAQSAAEPGALAPTESQVDLNSIGQQTRKLIGSLLAFAGFFGMWLIWVDVLPALGVLEEFTIWEIEGIQPGTPRYVTLADVLFAVVVACMTFMAARNIPGLIEIAVLQHLPLDSSVRYAVATLSQYVISLVGMLVICAAIGLSWSKAQWLVAALGVGLGFGLQEIFANFVSGIILLFERPIRVGDIITLGDVTGTVTRIRIRATTIRNWDRQELVVPNKDLITGRLLNWTLSDSTNRVVINVGVAYGSNTRRARELLLQIAGEHPRVLADPLPVATFEQFGDSTLNFVLRVHLAGLDHRLDTIHDLHASIHDRFAAEGIEIAFPQRDLNIRTIHQPFEFIQRERTLSEPAKRAVGDHNGQEDASS